MPVRGFKRIKAFLKKFRPGSKSNPRPAPHAERPPSWFATQIQRTFRTDKPLPELPSTSSVTATATKRTSKSLPRLPSTPSIPRTPLPELHRRGRPRVEQPSAAAKKPSNALPSTPSTSSIRIAAFPRRGSPRVEQPPAVAKRPSKSLPPLPSTPSVPRIPLPESHRRGRPRVEQPPGVESAESSTTDGSSIITTTTTTSVDADHQSSPMPPPTLPNPNTGSANNTPVQRSTRPNAPSPQSNNSGVTDPTSWSDLVEVDLAANIGPRDRARQEALFEIVFSEGRYVSELARMKEIFVDPLLHPFSSTPASSRPILPLQHPMLKIFDAMDRRIHDPDWSTRDEIAFERDIDALDGIVDGEAPMERTTQTNDISTLREVSKNLTPEFAHFLDAVRPYQLPEDLRICLEVIENDLLEGHVRFSEALKKRYEEQLPFVHSLEDILVDNSHILTNYIKYAHHLKRAVEQVDQAVECADREEPGVADEREDHRLFEVGAYIRRLEKVAAEKGETGLVTSLSGPLQRLFKYRDMFQNLFSHTYPSSSKYRSVLKALEEVQIIIWGIEDERVPGNEHDMTRDVLARIDGLDKAWEFAAQKPSRVLIEERVAAPIKPSSSGPLQPSGRGEKDLWFVVFNDVVLRCKRIGTTSLPGWGSHYTTRRNLYKFVRIETWNVPSFRERVAAMDKWARLLSSGRATRGNGQSRGEEAGVFDQGSPPASSSNSSWGADKTTLQKPVNVGQRQIDPTRNGAPYTRDPSAAGKFGIRPASTKSSVARPRPSHRPTTKYKKYPTKLSSLPEDITVETPTKGETTLLPEPTVATPRPSPGRRTRAKRDNNSPTKLPSRPNSGLWLSPLLLAEGAMLSLDPTLATPAEEDQENVPPELSPIQEDPDRNTEENFADASNLTTSKPQQEQAEAEAEEVYDENWRMSFQSDDFPVPGDFSRKYYES